MECVDANNALWRLPLAGSHVRSPERKNTKIDCPTVEWVNVNNELGASFQLAHM